MPPHTKLEGPPFSYLAPGGVWPDGPLVDDAPAEALLAQAIAKRLHEARGDRSGRDIARAAKISPTTVSKYLKGETWGDLPTLCRIELAVGTQLWGYDHQAVSRPRDWLADDAVWPTRPSRPRDYLADGAVWPIGPLRDSAPPEAHLVLAIAQRVHRAPARSTISSRWTGDQLIFHINAFLEGQSWGDVRVIAHLDATLASGLWGYEHPGISMPRNYVTAGYWPEGVPPEQRSQGRPPSQRPGQGIATPQHRRKTGPRRVCPGQRPSSSRHCGRCHMERRVHL